MDLQSMDSDALILLLKERVRVFSSLSEEDQSEVASQIEDLRDRGLPLEFLLSSARTFANERAAAAEETEHPLDEERQKFIEENALPPEERVSAKRQPRNEAKAREREELAARVRGLVREARSARQPHERKKMRRELLGIDQARLQRVLGREGQELCAEIRDLLLGSTDLR